MESQDLIPQLFRQEFSRIVAVISRQFGLEHIGMAEDIASETFLTATENWKSNGLPPNPTAWLYHVARQKTLYQFRRNRIFDQKIAPVLKADHRNDLDPAEVDFSNTNIRDSQLQMMFAVCDPVIASEAQIALALRILCGFSIEEIADAFLSNKETINKRLFRAKEKLRTEKVRVEMPSDHQINGRLDSVLHIIYLLFNEGYYSTTQNQIIRKDLCLEALRLGLLLTEYDKTNQPKTNALVALMYFHSSRLDARQSNDQYPILYEDQDESLWNNDFVEKGINYLSHSAEGDQISSYHLEAGIAFWHCQKEETIEKWENILQHYDILAQLNYSPIVALNRAYAIYRARGKEAALAEAQNLQLTTNHFYWVLLGELNAGVDNDKAREYFQEAFALAKTPSEKETIMEKIIKLSAVPNPPC